MIWTRVQPSNAVLYIEYEWAHKSNRVIKYCRRITNSGAVCNAGNIIKDKLAIDNGRVADEHKK